MYEWRKAKGGASEQGKKNAAKRIEEKKKLAAKEAAAKGATAGALPEGMAGMRGERMSDSLAEQIAQATI
jgi:hypothetical protein